MSPIDFGEEYPFPAHLALAAKAASYGAQIWIAVCTAFAFFGGPLPVPFFHIVPSGGIGSALLFLLIGGPILYLSVRIIATILLTVVDTPHRRQYYREKRAREQAEA